MAAASSPAPAASEAPVVPAVVPPPACSEAADGVGPWPRAAVGEAGMARVASGGAGRLGWLEQRFEAAGSPARLRFLGSHAFDLLGKVVSEGGGGDEARRRLVCAVLEAAARRGAPVLRIWGSLKQTGSRAELEAATDALALVLDENARRARPLRFVIALANHQAGWGSPRPEASLDDQDPASPWSARRFYLGGGWREEGGGLLAERMRSFAARAEIRSSPYVLAWELVNELDTHRSLGGGRFDAAEADPLRDAFLAPALEELASALPQPISAGELRGEPTDAYGAFARSVVGALSPRARARLVWTSHVYTTLDRTAPPAASAAATAAATAKLDRDLAIAAELGLPLYVGELGQHVRGAAPRFCGDGVRHDVPALLGAALAPAPALASRAVRRDAIEAAIVWGEGECRLAVGGDPPRAIDVGAGGDSADFAPGDVASRAALVAARRTARFRP